MACVGDMMQLHHFVDGVREKDEGEADSSPLRALPPSLHGEGAGGRGFVPNAP